MSEEKTIKESYATDTPIVKALGDHPKSRIISAFLSEKEYDLNISDISRIAGVSRNSVYEHIDELIELRIIEKTRKTGNSQMYGLNTESETVEKLEELEGILLKEILKLEDKSSQV